MPSLGRTLRPLAIGAGIGWSIAFVALGLGFGLQKFGDGSIFAYSITVDGAWAFHGHNIPGRVAVYVAALLPAEFVVRLTRNANVGIAVYGVLLFAMPGLGLIGTRLADRSPRRTFFAYASASIACLAPLVFGFPTEMWMAQSLFWPTLALAHTAPRNSSGALVLSMCMLALAFTHEGALVLEAVIVVTLALRGWRDPLFARAAAAFAGAIMVWLLVKSAIRPDDYIAGVLDRAALHFFDPERLTGSGLVRLLAATLGGFVALALLLARFTGPRAIPLATAIVAAALVVYWLGFDKALHADNRYYLRTLLLTGTAGFGALAAVQVLHANREMVVKLPLLPGLLAAIANPAFTRSAAAALLLVTLVQTVETGKFVVAWRGYTQAIRALATGTAGDPALGDPRFVSSARIDPALNRLSWNSTTPYLSVLVAPGYAPSRLVVDPGTGYFWLSCATATANAKADRVIPAPSRELIRVYSCLHR